VLLPRWQWRTCAADLSWLSARLYAPEGGRGRWADETHLVCQQSLHHAWLRGDTLELRWRKEVGSDGFELWDPILRASLPFAPADISRLFAAWGLAGPESGQPYHAVGAFLDAVGAAAPTVHPMHVAHRYENTFVDGIACSFETITTGLNGRWQSFAVEHEDPSVVAHVLGELGLDARDNINFIQGLKRALGRAGERH
jgi:hypothetical protein